jgi:hypothetical protein
MAENVVLFTLPLVTATEHRCALSKPGLSAERGDGRPSLTIIRRGTHLHHVRGHVGVADPGSAVLYRGEAPFRLSHPFAVPEPDLSLFLEFGPAVLAELFGAEPLACDLGQPLSPATQLAAATASTAMRIEPDDSLAGEERALSLLGLAARDLGTTAAEVATSPAAHRRAARAREALAASPEARHDLASLARDAGCSLFT